MAWPAWFGQSDVAKADAAIRSFSDAAWDHRLSCPTCLSKQPCRTLMEMIDAVAAETRSVGDAAFPKWIEDIENRYGPKDWRAR